MRAFFVGARLVSKLKEERWAKALMLRSVFMAFCSFRKVVVASEQRWEGGFEEVRVGESSAYKFL